MKKSVLLFCAMAALAVSCQKEPKGPVYPVPEPNTTYKFEGTVATEGFTWKTNSAIGVYSAMEDVKIINKPAANGVSTLLRGAFIKKRRYKDV